MKYTLKVNGADLVVYSEGRFIYQRCLCSIWNTLRPLHIKSINKWISLTRMGGRKNLTLDI